MTSTAYRHLLLAFSLIWGAAVSAGEPEDDDSQDQPYPTAVKVDYVIGCMLANGQTPEMLQKCSCSIDFIASAIPYKEYERVDTLLRLQQMSGAGRNAVYKNSPWSKKTLQRFREIQAESTLRCF